MMGHFKIYMTRQSDFISVITNHSDLEQLGRDLTMSRFIVGELVGEEDSLSSTPVRVLLPISRIDFVVED